MQIEKLFDRNELRRLEKAAKEKNKLALAEWARQFEEHVSEVTKRHYEREYKDALDKSVSNLLLAIAYSLHFNEKTKFGNDRLSNFMDDLMAVVEGFRTGEYTPEEYKEQLKKDKIYFDI